MIIDKRIVAMAKLCLDLHPHPSSSPHSILLQHTQRQNSLSHLHCHTSKNHRLLFLRVSLPQQHAVRQWDGSNAESKNFSFDSNDDESEDFDDPLDQSGDVLEDFIDSIWILKVFGSFGWMLPPIIISMLLTTGPKAFLMALALPLGQSTFAFAIQTFLNRDKIKPKPKKSVKKGKSRSNKSRNTKFQQAAEWIGSQGARKRKKGYQSWVLKEDVDYVGNSSDRDTCDYGGWDELVAGKESNVRSSQRVSQKTSGLKDTSPEKGKNRRRRSGNDAPLLLRLLISIFPFFGFLE